MGCLQSKIYDSEKLFQCSVRLAKPKRALQASHNRKTHMLIVMRLHAPYAVIKQKNITSQTFFTNYEPFSEFPKSYAMITSSKYVLVLSLLKACPTFAEVFNISKFLS